MSDEQRREALYRDFQESQHAAQVPATRASAAKLLDIVFEFAKPTSMLDVGCGFGTWLDVARDMGITDIRGIEGPWIDRTKLQIEAELVDVVDLEQGFSLSRRFDLVLCTEVAEHLWPAAAPILIEALTAHADIVLFSAAIPFQGGHHHVNEQFADYWAKLFSDKGFAVVDCIRPRVWHDDSVLWWLQQNALLFVSEAMLKGSVWLQEQHRRNGILSIVHPLNYAERAKHWEDYDSLMAIIGKGGNFYAKVRDGKLRIMRS